MVASLFDLSGKTAMVTGGTRGIGQAMAIALAEAGADIVLIQVEQTKKTLTSVGTISDFLPSESNSRHHHQESRRSIESKVLHRNVRTGRQR